MRKTLADSNTNYLLSFFVKATRVFIYPVRKKFCKMNGLRILSKRSLNDCVGHIGPATLGLRPLGSETSAYLLSYLAKAFDFKANLRMFGKP